MGKEELKEKANEKGGEGEGNNEEEVKNEPKKKVIKKKMPFKSTLPTGNEDDLKDWKPTKIERRLPNQPASKMTSQSIAESFLSSLSKPVNKSTNKSAFFDDDEPIRLLSKPVINMKKLTPQQIKWDIEDQTFIQKQFIPSKKIEKSLEEEPDEELGELEGKELLGRNAKPQTKMKHIDISKIVNENWQEAAQRKTTRNQLWEGAQGLLDGRGNLAKLAKEAQQKATQIESELNKRSYEKKQMKNRYGW